MITIGIDEAGRGPVIGPMIIAGVGINEDISNEFKSIGVKDSKLLSIKRIYLLEREIKKSTQNYKTIKISSEEIDNRFEKGKNLNYLELDSMAVIANDLSGEKVIIDSPSSNTKKIKEYLQNLIKRKIIIAENYADRNHVEVSAASILAKSEREREVDKIKKIFGYDFGSGYPSDPKTVEFLKIIKENGKIDESPYKELIRKSWSTLQSSKDKNLDSFI
ncbi:MAG: Ribonuclease HII [Candidatus Parvarchaeum acidophilus ARMAN-5_'5-way FS']|jgi:ribonuclease HII|uniref:Ribonuclease n=2 Tax=Parvarchaeum acidophilus TaxID=662761 RepID=D6GWV0_PARA5|nr:MAG: ribonuclease HII [Candidatus Parvarchaeum acidophilus ARMAN-5]EGD71965.1 MAG: Ribonuclease HII [Candidatus Parvarchaeum acidophilus ARMAN-5_'5-way FS']